MIAKTHISFALCVASCGVVSYEIFVERLENKDLIVLFTSIGFGALLPDIDEPHSTIGRKTPLVSHVFNKIFGHRGATHTLIFPLVIAFLLYLLMAYLPFSPLILYGVVCGCYLHIAGDMLTKSGCPIYMPFSTRNIAFLPYRLRFKTGGMIDRCVGHVCTFLFALFVAHFAGLDMSWATQMTQGSVEQFLKHIRG